MFMLKLMLISQTGFEFHKRRAVPTVVGIVIAEEHETMVLDVSC
jgi:hypothetical protein